MRKKYVIFLKYRTFKAYVHSSSLCWNLRPKFRKLAYSNNRNSIVNHRDIGLSSRLWLMLCHLSCVVTHLKKLWNTKSFSTEVRWRYRLRLKISNFRSANAKSINFLVRSRKYMQMMCALSLVFYCTWPWTSMFLFRFCLVFRRWCQWTWLICWWYHKLRRYLDNDWRVVGTALYWYRIFWKFWGLYQ